MTPASHAPRAFLRALYDVAVARAQPTADTLAPFLPAPPAGRTVVIGAGKASAAMAAALEALWPVQAPLSGLVVTRYGHVPIGARHTSSRIAILQAAHPVPDTASQDAAERIAQQVQGLDVDDLVIALFSGGGSALMAQPALGLTLAEKQAIHTALLRSGATIAEINCVRKHLSALKGGRLAALAAPAHVVTLLISDVPGDDPATIASGPTVPDASTCAEALAICQRYQLTLPAAALAGLRSGQFETPKPGDARFASQRVQLIATPQHSLEAAAALAQSHGVAAHILSNALEGESSDIGQMHAAIARQVAQHGQPFTRPCVILSGGETTVTLGASKPTKAPSRGGRASEFLLSCTIALQGEPGVYALAADTDGIDGSEDNAGALATPSTLARAAALGLSPAEHLDRHDSYSFFAALGDLVMTGPSFTNVNDFRALYLP
ncbi:glycerate kinase type-2 family protein [Simplicispira psychrophila]|uniref:glycerate kinase type-2 family protein n=1 Tax=Simplicispira psychrophila TaxID=80882 RepID=UPI000484C60C|nr:glycerate kinase [Simplicispira psychrophila]